MDVELKYALLQKSSCVGKMEAEFNEDRCSIA